jgi:carbamoyltransferase
MRILGIAGFAHDAAVAVVIHGRLVFAVENERVTRRKGEWTFPTTGIELALRRCDLKHSDIDLICFYWDDAGNLINALKNEAKNVPRFGASVLSRMRSRISAASSNREVVETLRAIWPCALPRVEFIDHHYAHARYAYLVSGYETSACLIVDGRGEFATASVYDCVDGRLSLRWQQGMPASLGYVYGAVTQHLGFEPLADEYRVMGLAPYGNDDAALDAWFERLLSFDGNSLRVAPELIEYHRDERPNRPWLSAKAHVVLGSPRRSSEPLTPRHADIALAAQKRYETVFLELAEFARRTTGRSHLVLGGGCAMNSVANGKLTRFGLFENVFVPPAPGDQGCAIGAALAHVDHGIARVHAKHNASPFLGPSYTAHELVDTLRRNKLAYSTENVIERAAALISTGRIGAVFDGAMEFGPRALGNRSIVADPRVAETRDRLNAVVKMREAFRPFAGAVFDDTMDAYFDRAVESPYMNVVVQVREHARALIPAIVHVDGSCRIQTLSRDQTLFARLLQRFEEITGIGILVNTSFNIKGEPIVMTPEDAVRCFYGTGLDFLLLGECLLEKPNA